MEDTLLQSMMFPTSRLVGYVVNSAEGSNLTHPFFKGTFRNPYYSLIPLPFPNPLVRMGMVWVPLMGSLETSLVSTKVLHDAFTRSISNSCSLLLRGTMNFQGIESATHLIVTRVCAVYKNKDIHTRIYIHLP